MVSADDDEAEEEEGKGKYDRTIMPEQVVCLEAPDDFLKLRIMDLPESAVNGTHNTEAGLLRRLAEYRAVNTEDETVLNFFDELEIHPEKIGKHLQVSVFRRINQGLNKWIYLSLQFVVSSYKHNNHVFICLLLI